MAGVPDCLSGVNNVEGSIPFVAALVDFVLFLIIYLEIDKYAKEGKEVSLHIQNDKLIEW